MKWLIDQDKISKNKLKKEGNIFNKLKKESNIYN